MIPHKMRDNTQTAAVILSSKYLGNVINIFIAKLQS